jgi:hypothetical protein
MFLIQDTFPDIAAVTCSNWFLLADLSTLKMEATRSSETSVHTRSTWRHITEDDILYSHHRENSKSYEDESVHVDVLCVHLVTAKHSVWMPFMHAQMRETCKSSGG